MSENIKEIKGQEEDRLAMSGAMPFNSPLNLSDPSSLTGLSSAIIPADRMARIRKAKKYRDIDLISKLLQMRVDYALNIKDIKCKNKRQKRFYQENVLPLINKLAREFELEYHSIGDVYIHYGFKQDDKTPLFLKIEDAENVEQIGCLGYEKYKVKISAEFRRQLKDIIKDKSIKLPKYIRSIVDESAKTLKIGEALMLDGENMFRISNTKQSYETYPIPPLMRIAKAIELRELLLEGDFCDAFQLKNTIMHTRVGTENKAPSKERVENIHNLIINKPSTTMELTTPFDVNISKVSMIDENSFNNDKYMAANQRILQYFGISLSLIPNSESGSSYNAGIISVKPFQQSLKTDRRIFSEFLEHYFNLINEKNGFREEVEIEWEADNLGDVKEKLAQMQFGFDVGVLSYQDICEEFDFDQEEQLEKKRWDYNNSELIRPWHEASQGLLKVTDAKFKQQKELKEAGTVDNTEKTETVNDEEV